MPDLYIVSKNQLFCFFIFQFLSKIIRFVIQVYKRMRYSSESRSNSRKAKRKDKKGKKERKRSYSSSLSNQKKQKKKYRENDRSQEKDRKKKDHKHKERNRSRSKDKKQKRQKDQSSKRQSPTTLLIEKKTQQLQMAQKNIQSPIKKQITEQQRMRKLAMRKVKARLLKLKDLFASDKQESDSQSQKPKENFNNLGKQVPPPIPPATKGVAPPAPPSSNAQSNQIKVNISGLQKSGKRQSKWGKTSSNQSNMTQLIRQQAIKNEVQQKSQRKLSLQPQHSQDVLRLSQDKSIQVEPHNEINPLQVIDQQYIDPLDEFMMDIQCQATKQMDLPKKNNKKVITFEEVITNQINNAETAKMNTQTQDEDQNFRKLFLSAIQRLDQKNSEEEDEKGIMFENNEDRNTYEQFQQEKQPELDFFAKQRRMAQRKQLGVVDHTQIKYEQVKFNLYREAEQVKNMSFQQVNKYRKQAGDIKVRGKDMLNPVFNWYQCGLSDKILSVIQKRNYGKPFPIQAQSLPLIMSGRDVIGIAETGSGKTLSYLLPTLRHIIDQKPVQQGDGPISIIMTPTRQLARQVYLQAKVFCKSLNIRVLAVYGGLGVQTQLSDFRKGAELVICTPGRMIDILTLNKGKITNLRRVTLIVIDEADRMFDLGFQPQITRIIENARPHKQVVMFSATFPKNVQTLARRILNKPVQIIVGSRGQACRNVEQVVVVLEQTSKFLKLLQILGVWNQKGSVLIFVDKQNEVDYLFQQLLKYGYHALTLHGAMDPDDRQFTIYDFKKGIKTIMIATSVCARGLDIKAICLVVNFKCPDHLEDYIHRIGRTGRAGTKGTAITFITSQQQKYSIDLIKALQMSEIHPPEELKKLSQSFLSKVKKGEARKIRNKNLKGSGFKFDQQQEQKVNQIKSALKKQLKSQGLGGFQDSDEQDIQMKKKKEQNQRGRNQQDRIAQAIKNPEIKNKLLSEAVKAVTQAMKNDNRLTTEKILQIAIGSMKQSVTKHKVVRTVDDGVEQVTKLINQFQNKGLQGTDFFSYDFEINDYPLNARQKACNQSFLHGIQHQTNCSISLRGVYVQPGKKPPVGSRKLYLHIQGQNKYYVTTAYKQIKRVLQENAYEAIHSGMGPGKYSI